jgi:hypothetical protein
MMDNLKRIAGLFQAQNNKEKIEEEKSELNSEDILDNEKNKECD